jgi:hypothetical protein
MSLPSRRQPPTDDRWVAGERSGLSVLGPPVHYGTDQVLMVMVATPIRVFELSAVML